MNEAGLLDILNNTHNLELESTGKNKFCRWDAESDKYLAELKCRRTHYDTQMIEYDKLDCVKAEADKTNREFLYCVSTPEGLYIFNVSKLCQDGYDFKWENKYLPYTTDFFSKAKRTKKVGYIDVKDSYLTETLEE